jgi:hypothetical protein
MFGFDMPTSFRRPKDVVDGQVCRLDSLKDQLASTCPEYQRELFIAGTEPGAGAPSPADPAAPVPGVGDVWTTSQAVVVPLPPPPDAVGADGKPVKQAPALLCLPGGGDFGADKAQPVAVLPLPADERERHFTLEWAASSGWAALEPSQPCSPDMVAAALAPGSLLGALQAATGLSPTLGVGLLPVHRLEYRLNLAPERTLPARTVLTGTVRYDPNVVEYYKVELGRGRRPEEWMTLGDVHREQVQDGPIEVLDAPSLPPGEYVVRLVMVGKDGNFLGQPYAVPVRLGDSPNPSPGLQPGD